MTRVSVEDLEAGIEWLSEGFEGDEDTKARLSRVAAFVDTEIQQRKTKAAIRQIVRETGASPAQARRALRRKTEGQS